MSGRSRVVRQDAWRKPLLQEMTEMERRAFLRSAGQTALYLLATRFPTGDAGLLGAEHLDITADELTRLRGLDGQYGAGAAVLQATERADHLYRQLKSTSDRAALQPRLALLAGEAASLAGWCALNLGDPQTAMAWSRVAADCGEHGRHPDMHAWGIWEQARILEAAGRYDDALGVLKRPPLERVSAPVRVEVETLRARAAARVRGYSQREVWSLTALDRAQEAVAKTDDAPSQLPWMWLVTSSYVEVQRGRCHAWLGRGEEAYASLSAGLREHPKGLYRGAGELHLSLAHAAVVTGDIERATDHARQADEVFTTVRAVRQADELRRFRRIELAPFSDTRSVRELDEQLRAPTRYVTTRSMRNRQKVHQRTCPSLHRGQTPHATSWREGNGLEPIEVVALVAARPAEARPRLEVCQTCIIGR
jgi:tetratricopeptide (TPR) repeat protein